jgi:hypothetical protein
MDENKTSSLKSRVNFKRCSVNDEFEVKAFATANLATATLLITMPMQDFYNKSVVSNANHATNADDVAQRSLNKPHATKIAVFIVKTLVKQTQKMRMDSGEERSKVLDDILEVLGTQSYASLPPFVCNLRGVETDLSNLNVTEVTTEENEPACLKIKLRAKDVFHVVDGQHRRHAMKQVLDFLNEACTVKKLKKSSLLAPYQPDDMFAFTEAMTDVLSTARWNSSVQMDCHVGLDIRAERQLFYDHNDLTKKMDKVLVTTFDTSSPIFEIVENLTHVDSDFECLHSGGEFEKSDIIAVTSKLLTNRVSAHGVKKLIISERESLADKFWNSINANIIDSNYCETNMLYSVGVLKALAGLVFSLSFSKTADIEKAGQLINLIEDYNFDLRTNPVFSIQVLNDSEIEKNDLGFIKKRLDIHIKKSNDYSKNDIETTAIMQNQKAHLVKVYANIFLAILENS